MRIKTYFMVTPKGFASSFFKNKKDAIIHANKEYRFRNSKDGYDEYWNNLPIKIERVIEIKFNKNY